MRVIQDQYANLVKKITANQVESLEITRFQNFSDYQIQMLCRLIAQNTSLRSLEITNKNLGPENAHVLAQNNSIEYLSLRDNNLGDLGAVALAQNTTIKRLGLERNHIGDQGAIALSNSALRCLSLDGNCISCQAVEHLVAMDTLRCLSLSSNDIGDEGARIIAETTSLTCLVLSSNNISKEGAIALAKNTSLHTVDIDFNPIEEDEEGIAEFINIVLNNQGSHLYRTCIDQIDQALINRKEDLLSLANNLLPTSLRMQRKVYDMLSDNRKIWISVKILEKQKLCRDQIIFSFLTKNNYRDGKIGNRLPIEISQYILSFIYPNLSDRGIGRAWELAEKKLQQLSNKI